MQSKSIEHFFLNTILMVTIGGVALVFVTDLILYPQDQLSLVIDAAILLATLIAYITRVRYPLVAVFILTQTVVASMVYQCLHVPLNTTFSLAILLVVGFIYSVMLPRILRAVMHATTIAIVAFIFVVQFRDPSLQISPDINNVETVAITYGILYFVLTYSTAVLKSSYDRLNTNLNTINNHLEEMVAERTEKIIRQNEALVKYSYTNAHHLRGPVARLLGLANLSKISNQDSLTDIISMMEQQAVEIDQVVSQINRELEVDSYLNSKDTQEVA